MFMYFGLIILVYVNFYFDRSFLVINRYNLFFLKKIIFYFFKQYLRYYLRKGFCSQIYLGNVVSLCFFKNVIVYFSI